MSMSYRLFSSDRIVSELNDGPLSQYMALTLGKIFIICRILDFTSIIMSDATG